MASMPHDNSISRIFTVLSLPVLPLLPIPLSLSLATVGLVTVLIACSPESHRVVSTWGMRPLQTDFIQVSLVSFHALKVHLLLV